MNINFLHRAVLLFFVSSLCLISRAQDFSQKSSISLVDFSVSAKKEKITINWEIADAKEANYFEIQKSLDGRNYKTFALVLGADPKQKGNHYGCFDKFIKKEATHCLYRIKQIDNNGFEQFSESKNISGI